MTHSRTPPPPGPFRQTRVTFSADHLEEFLESGWFLSIPSRQSRQVLVGWGRLRTHATSPITASLTPSSDTSTREVAGSRSGAALFAPDFRFRFEQPWITTPFWDLVPRDVFADLVNGAEMPVLAATPALEWKEPARALFDHRFSQISERFESGILDKAVPVVFATTQSQVDRELRLHILQNLSRLAPHLIIYGFWGALDALGRELSPNASGVETAGVAPSGMMGVTPELLFSLVSEASPVAPQKLETAALAATRGKPTDPAQNMTEAQALLDDPKERAEHQFVIDDIRQVLKKVGDVETGETRVLELPTLFHLKTSIRAQLAEPLSVDQAARLLHPTPALGFSPRALGINEMDNWDDGEYRWRYGAPFGVDAVLEIEAGAAERRADLEQRSRSPEQIHSPERIQDCVVAIRNVQWLGQDVRLGSGCGVVRASIAEREWQELKLKRDSVKRILGI